MKPLDSLESFKENLFQITSETFTSNALALFKFQARNNAVYNEYLSHLKVDAGKIDSLDQIPFLPIDFFKSHRITTGKWNEKRIFKSSGTGLTGRSSHYIEDIDFYHKVSLEIAQSTFGSLSKKTVLGLLPSYLEQGDSSLVEMVNHFNSNASRHSGFYLHDHDQLIDQIENSTNQVFLIGVSYALLDLANTTKIDLSEHIVIETGGMKGRKKEMLREDLHVILKDSFNTESIYSEYGMTELLSQAYGASGLFHFPKWCLPMVRDLDDPFSMKSQGSGALNIIDLANAHSCAFIETKDLISLDSTGKFEVLGRMDNSDIRGCSLLI